MSSPAIYGAIFLVVYWPKSFPFTVSALCNITECSHELSVKKLHTDLVTPRSFSACLIESSISMKYSLGFSAASVDIFV